MEGRLEKNTLFDGLFLYFMDLQVNIYTIKKCISIKIILIYINIILYLNVCSLAINKHLY